MNYAKRILKHYLSYAVPNWNSENDDEVEQAVADLVRAAVSQVDAKYKSVIDNLEERVKNLEKGKEVAAWIADIQYVIHETAKEKGWYDQDVSVTTSIVNIHGEVSESWEYYRKGGQDKHLPKWPGMWVELADVMIRCLDTLAYHKYDGMYSTGLGRSYNEFDEFVSVLHNLLAGLDSPNNIHLPLSRVVSEIIRYAADNDIPIREIVEEKTAYNATRPYRHGGLKA